MLVVESICAGISGDGHVAGSLAVEGQAMLSALLANLNRVDGWQFLTLLHESGSCVVPHGVDVRRVTGKNARSEFEKSLGVVDAAWIIAPEIDGELLELTDFAESAGCKLYSPDSHFVAMASDKSLTANHLAGQGIAVPSGGPLDAVDSTEFTFPAILKDNWGAGSQGTRLVKNESELPPRREWLRYRLETFVLGRPASASFACGTNGPVLMGSSWQTFADRFEYVGGTIPMPTPYAERAERLARQTIAAMPATHGYVGVDMMLGDASDPGADSDVVLEINPRLTTSYLGLRAATSENLAELVLEVADGVVRTTPKVVRAVEFRCDGSISRR